MKLYETDKTLYPVHGASVKELIDLGKWDFPSKYFVLFIAADFSKIDHDIIFTIAYELINKGLLYICTWGQDCALAHDIFDEAAVAWELDNKKEQYYMSTWHEDESISEALEFCMLNAMVKDELERECSTIVISVNNSDWKSEIDKYLRTK